MRDLAKHGVGAEHEVAAVPKVVICDVARRRLGIRLLDEGLNGKCRCTVELGAGANVTVIGRGRGGTHTERDNPSACGRGRGIAAGGEKLLRLANDVIGSENKYDCGGVALRSKCSSNSNSRAGIAPRRLEHDV